MHLAVHCSSALGLFSMLCFLSCFGGPIGPSVFTLIYFRDVSLSVCRFVRFSGFSLISHELLDKTYIYMHIIRTGSMRRLKLCALFVVSTYISRVINENVRKMAKTKTLNFKFMRQMIYHLVGHEILNITVYFIFHFNVQSCTQIIRPPKCATL